MKRRRKKDENSAKAIRQARKACGFTQHQLGVRLKLKGGPQAVYRWERGSSAPTARSARELARVLAEIDKQVAADLWRALASARGEAAASLLASSEANTDAAQPRDQADAVAPGTDAAASATRSTLDEPLVARTQTEPPSVSSDRFTVEYLTLRMADELEVPARRVRMPLFQLLRQVHETGLALSSVMQELARWIEAADTRAAALSARNSL